MFQWLKNLFSNGYEKHDNGTETWTSSNGKVRGHNPPPTTKKPVKQNNNVVYGDMVGRDLVKQTTVVQQTIVGNNNIQSASSIQRVDPFDMAVQTVLIHSALHDCTPSTPSDSGSSYDSCSSYDSGGSSNSGSSGGNSGGGGSCD